FVPNLVVYLAWCARTVDDHDELLSAEQIDDRLRLLVEIPKPLAHSDLVVVRSLNQVAAADIADPFVGGSMKHQVVVEPARRAQSSRLDSLEHDLVRHVDQNHGINVIALEEELGLPPIPREAVKYESVVPIMLIKSPTDDLFDDLVWHQLPLAHDSHDSPSQLRVYLTIPPDNVTLRNHA